jgi:hypothetical protein
VDKHSSLFRRDATDGERKVSNVGTSGFEGLNLGAGQPDADGRKDAAAENFAQERIV